MITNDPEDEEDSDAITLPREQEEQSGPRRGWLWGLGGSIAILILLGLLVAQTIFLMSGDLEVLQAALWLNVTSLTEENEQLKATRHENQRLNAVQQNTMTFLTEENERLKYTHLMAVTSLKEARGLLKEAQFNTTKSAETLEATHLEIASLKEKREKLYAIHKTPQ